VAAEALRRGLGIAADEAPLSAMTKLHSFLHARPSASLVGDERVLARILNLPGGPSPEGQEPRGPPQVSRPMGGDPMWYDLYRRILNSGKSVQAIGVKPDEVIPLINAVGTNGLYIMVNADNEDEARALEEAVKPYRH
jgi:hypothetical protein